MSETKLPKAVADFVERHLTAAAQADVLLLLHRQQERSWTVSAVCEELRIDTEYAGQLLGPLVADGLLQRKADGFVYEPRTPRLAAAADAFVAAYPSYRVAIISLIYSKYRPIRDFSDAFRLRSEDDE